MEAHPVEERTPWGAKIGKEFAVSVELDPPPGLDASKSIKSAQFLKDNGIDAVNIADGPRAIARMGPTALAIQVQQQTGMETIIHYCCRDRNLLAMQMDLIGSARIAYVPIPSLRINTASVVATLIDLQKSAG